MTTFTDGPAAGLGLILRRAPLFLRVVHNAAYAAAVCKKDLREWDALDQLGDTPAASETIYAYRRIGAAGRIHLNVRGLPLAGGSGWYATAKYALVDPQPRQERMRSTEGWRAWCLAKQALEAIH